MFIKSIHYGVLLQLIKASQGYDLPVEDLIDLEWDKLKTFRAKRV